MLQNSKNNKPTVVAIDDFSMNLMLIKTALNEIVNIYTVKSAGAAMLTIDKIQNVDLFLLDLEMPEMTGFEFLDFLRNSSVFKTTPVIIISSNSKFDTIKKAMNYSITDYIAKPFDAEVLREKVSKILKLPFERREQF